MPQWLKAGVLDGQRSGLNVIEGAGVSLTLADNPSNDRADLTIAALAGAGSPLTTKGDLYGFAAVPARVPVGVDGIALVADSTQTTGLNYATHGPASHTDLTRSL